MRTQNIPFSIKKKEYHPRLSKICSYRIFFSKGLKNEFETAVVNEPSVFEPSKSYCIYHDHLVIRYSFPSKFKTNLNSSTKQSQKSRFFGLFWKRKKKLKAE